jgi:4-azaleucine resistance transporter AzlC
METTGMSLFVFAGASQFIAVSRLGAGAGVYSVVLTTFVVNSRHMLMTSALARYFPGLALKKMIPLSGQVTDESFALAMSDTSRIAGKPDYLMALQMTAYGAWVTGSVAGALFGSVIDSASFGIPFAMTALFICLLVMQVTKRLHLVVAVTAGIIALGLQGVLPNNLHIIIAAVGASAVGLWLSSRRGGSNNGWPEPKAGNR